MKSACGGFGRDPGGGILGGSRSASGVAMPRCPDPGFGSGYLPRRAAVPRGHRGPGRDVRRPGRSAEDLPQPPASSRHGRLLLPDECLRPARRPRGTDLPSARIAHLAPVVRHTVASLSAPGRAVVGVPFLDTHRPAAVNGPAEALCVIASATSRRRYRPSPAVGVSLGLPSRTMRDAGFGARAFRSHIRPSHPRPV